MVRSVTNVRLTRGPRRSRRLSSSAYHLADVCQNRR
jgi:hypothetical protein